MSKSFKEHYECIKNDQPEALILFRKGDFYEAHFDDAKPVAQTLGLTLCSTAKGGGGWPVAGFMAYLLDGYLRKLVASGFRVAVCDRIV